MGKMAFRTFEFRAIAIPIGIPTMTHNNIPIKTIVVVSIALSQKRGFKNPIQKRQKPTNIVVPTFFPLEK